MAKKSPAPTPVESPTDLNFQDRTNLEVLAREARQKAALLLVLAHGFETGEPFTDESILRDAFGAIRGLSDDLLCAVDDLNRAVQQGGLR